MNWGAGRREPGLAQKMNMKAVLLLPGGHLIAIKYSITRRWANNLTARRFGRELWRGLPKISVLRESGDV